MEQENKMVIFQHAQWTYWRQKIQVNDQLMTLEWTGGYDRRIDGKEGAYFSTDDQSIIDALKNHPDYNRKFFILEKFQLDQLKSETESPSQTAVGSNEAPLEILIVPKELETIQERCDYINEKLGVPKKDINTIAKLEEWRKNNPGRIDFES